tara:strand:+ start:1875 stop:2270 length:396 start_codon:yes stop_codon:yes gene_type:complete
LDLIGRLKMGLDQYATARKGEGTIDEDGYTYYKDSIELAYWRKHPNLQGWMQNLYYEKGGEGEFNCVDLEIDEEDLDKLEETLDSKELPETSGFFFGNNSDDHYAEADRDFIVQARAALKQGYTVIYYSWW